MKKIISLALLITLSITTFAQPTMGLVAKYSFNFGNAHDEVGTNNGIVSGATLTTDRFGNVNHAYNFNAATMDYITIPNDPAIDFDNTTDFSVAFWMEIHQLNNAIPSILLAKHLPGSWNGFGFSANGSDLGYCNGHGVFSFYSASSAMQDACADNLISNDFSQWQFVTGIYHSATNTTDLYIDAVKQMDNGSVGGFLSNTEDIHLGGLPSWGAYYTGKIDDLLFYNRALDTADINSIYKLGNPVFPQAVSNNELKSASIKTSPNPATNQITFSETSHVNIKDITGASILSLDKVNKIDISMLKKGIYFIQFLNEKGITIQTTKIIKE